MWDKEKHWHHNVLKFHKEYEKKKKEVLDKKAKK